ncbi:unnamed protein product, partial [marine sediment metagenome]
MTSPIVIGTTCLRSPRWVGVEASGADVYGIMSDDNPTVAGQAFGGITTFYGDKVLSAGMVVCSGGFAAANVICSPQFCGGGAGVTALNASNISTGTLNSLRLESTSIPHQSSLMGGSCNLDSKVAPGFWHQNSNADAASGSNYPVTLAGSLMVLPDAGTTQFYTTYKCAASGGAASTMYIRGCYSGSWSSWHKVWHSGNDGAGSGLSADNLDGVSSGSFLRSDTGDIKSSGSLCFNDNIQLTLGNSNDTRFYHDGSNSFICHCGTG